ncbi:hypothetical protein ScPMuIL_015930 [Solemya velum]
MEDRLADNFQDGELEEAMDMSRDFNVNISIEQHHDIQERSIREEVPSIPPEERPGSSGKYIETPWSDCTDFINENKMIYLSLIARSRDGLPLAANTDGGGEGNCDIQEGHKQMKALARLSPRLPDRCTFTMDNFCIHFISALDLYICVLCDSNYPAVLAFSFLSDVQRQFLQSYEKSQVDSVIRPYQLIDFDRVLQKLKHMYNNPRSLTSKLNLSDLSQELRLRPAHIVSPEDLQSSHSKSNSRAAWIAVQPFFKIDFYPSEY